MAADVWRTLASLYSTQTRTRSVNTRIALATTRKNQLSISDYFAKMRGYSDEMASTGNAITDAEFISYVLAGLDEDYNSVFTAVVARIDTVTPAELYTQLLSFEQHLALQAAGSHAGSSSALAASRGRGDRFGSPGRGPGRGRSSGGRGSSSTGARSSTSSSHPRCQVCLKVGHRANASETRTAGLATTLYDTDPNWYTDSDTTDHITGELDKLTMHDRYNGNDQIHAANGAGMEISRIGKSIVPTPSRNLVLNNVLHVPTAHKNLISVHRFTLNKNTFIEFHPYFFLIKD
jgi:hypothetical protein